MRSLRDKDDVLTWRAVAREISISPATLWRKRRDYDYLDVTLEHILGALNAAEGPVIT